MGAEEGQQIQLGGVMGRKESSWAHICRSGVNEMKAVG